MDETASSIAFSFSGPTGILRPLSRRARASALSPAPPRLPAGPDSVATRAHRRAESAAERALEDFQDEETAELFGPAVHAELEMKAAYLKTFARASGAALRATLDVTRSELQRLRPTEPDPPAEIPAYRISASGDVEELPASAVGSVRLPAAVDIPFLTVVPPSLSAG